jgi:ethanolamine utilization protein EutN
MYLAKVIGTVVATQKAEGLEGVKLLLVTPVDEGGKAVGAAQTAADAVQSGEGELVYVVTGREAALSLSDTFVPVDLAVVGHVDDVVAHVPSESELKATKPERRPARRKAGRPRARRRRR